MRQYSIGLGYECSPRRQEAITRNNDDPDFWFQDAVPDL